MSAATWSAPFVLALAALAVPAALAQNGQRKPAPPTTPTAPAAPVAPAVPEANTPAAMTTPAVASNLIPRDTLFGNPDRAALRVSPDGTKLAFIAPLAGVLNIWVAPADKPDEARPVTKDTGRGIRSYFWAYTNSDILYTQDKGGDENFKIYRVDLSKDETKDLTPFESITGPDGKPIMLPSGQALRPRAEVEGVSHKYPGTIVIGLNNRNPQFHDLHKLDVKTGELTLLQENNEFAGYLVDDDYNVRTALRQTEDGGTELLKAEGAPGAKGIEKFGPFQKIGSDDALTTSPVGLSPDGKTLYMLDSRGRNTGALFSVDIASGKSTMMAENKLADAGGVVSHPTTGVIQAVSFNYKRPEWTILDKGVQADFDYLKTVADGDVSITSRTLDDSKWTVAYLMDNGPARTYLYDRKAKKATFVFSNRKALETVKLEKMQPVVISSRDGLDMVSYLTLPPGSDANGDGRPDSPVPMVLNVHGGPWARDTWGLNPEHQWLANRGYAVLSVNFRGSTGFGKAFINAGNREWAGKMHDDLIDAVNWAIKQKIADPAKVAIYGGSYGGYSALVGVTFTPEVFACSVAIVGPSNINTLLSTIPPYWQPMIEMFTQRVGDFKSEEGKKFLESRSPLNFIDRIKKPLLIGQGANDPRVKQSESDQIVKAMQAKRIPVTYVLFPDEGHGFARPNNRLAFYAVAEEFLAQHLGGSNQPVGDDFKGSSVTVPTGSEFLPGVAKSLSSQPAAAAPVK